MFRTLTALVTTTAAVLAVSLTAASPAAAADPCWQSGGKWWCHNLVGAPLLEPETGAVIDHLRTNPSVFVCRQEGNSHGGGGPHPNRWLWTQGDDHGRWGWVKDTDVASETDSLPVC